MTSVSKLQKQIDALEARRVELRNTMPSGYMKFGELPGVGDEELAFWAKLAEPVNGQNINFGELEVVLRNHSPSWGNYW